MFDKLKNAVHFATCPNCVAINTIVGKHVSETVFVRVESFIVVATSFDCVRCKESFFPIEGDLSWVLACESYRERHHLVQAAEIIAFREGFSMTQEALAEHLGWDANIVQRYEEGKLQSDEHDYVLRLVMENPEIFLGRPRLN